MRAPRAPTASSPRSAGRTLCCRVARLGLRHPRARHLHGHVARHHRPAPPPPSSGFRLISIASPPWICASGSSPSTTACGRASCRACATSCRSSDGANGRAAAARSRTSCTTPPRTRTSLSRRLSPDRPRSAQEWAARLGLDGLPADQGLGETEVLELTDALALDHLDAYADAVTERSRAVLDALDIEALDSRARLGEGPRRARRRRRGRGAVALPDVGRQAHVVLRLVGRHRPRSEPPRRDGLGAQPHGLSPF